MIRKFHFFSGRNLSSFGCCSLKLFPIQLEDKRAGGQKRQGQFTMEKNPFEVILELGEVEYKSDKLRYVRISTGALAYMINQKIFHVSHS